MKKLFSALLVLLSLALMLTAFAACERKDPNNDGSSELPDGSDTEPNETDPEAPKYVFVSDGSTEYSIVTSSLASDVILDAANGLKRVFKNKTGADISIGTDLYNTSNPNYTFPKYEILVGETNRPESKQCAEGLAYDDYVIEIVNGKLVVLGGNDDATASAVEKLKGYISGKTLELAEGELVRYDHEYDIKQLTVGGHDISEFSIVMSSKSKCSDLAESIIKAVRELYGVTLTAEVRASAGEDACEIVIGDLGIDKVKTLAVDEYQCNVLRNRVFIDGGSTTALQRFGDKLYEYYKNAGLSGNVELELPSSLKSGTVELAKYALADGATFRIMSNNILIDGIENRAELIVAKYLEYLPDIIGIQECNATGQTTVVKALSDFYGSAVTVQDDKSIAPYTPILYRKDKYTVVEGGSYFFDSRYTKTNTKSLTWAVFEEIKTGKRFAVVNAHYALVSSSYDLPAGYTNAVEGAQWRNDNSRQMLERAQAVKDKYGNIPVFLTGDLNSNSTQESIQMLEKVFTDAINAATVSSSTGVSSGHGSPGQAPSSKLPIDHVFVDTDLVTVYTHKILTDKSSLAISDHSPVVVDLSFNN